MLKVDRDAALSAAQLKERLSYDPETGHFTRRAAGGNNRWRVGQTAGSVTDRGYIIIWVNGIHYLAHRLAVLYMTGAWPSHSVDHADGIVSNNSWSNLRQCSHSENHQNVKRHSNNSSGYLGVYPVKAHKTKPWSSSIMVKGKRVNLGYFYSPEDASAAYLAAKEKYHEFQPAPRDMAA